MYVGSSPALNQAFLMLKKIEGHNATFSIFFTENSGSRCLIIFGSVELMSFLICGIVERPTFFCGIVEKTYVFSTLCNFS